MARIAALLLCASCAGIALVASEKRDQTPAELAALMRAKLASTHKMTEGLIVKDFNLIRNGGEELLQVADATQWSSYDDPVYAHHRDELKRQAAKLAQLAKDKNLDGAAYAHIQIFTTCMNCHEYCREVLHVVSTPPNLRPVDPVPVLDEEETANRKPPVQR